MAKPDHKLTDPIREFICQRLGAYDTPSTIAAMVKEEFGIEITRQTVEGYDPEKMDRRGKSLAEKWRFIVDESREAYRKGVAEVPIMIKTVRLERYERAYRLAEARGNVPLMLEVLAAASKEAHDFYAKRGTGLGFGMMDGEGEGAGDDEHRGGYELVVVASKDGRRVM